MNIRLPAKRENVPGRPYALAALSGAVALGALAIVTHRRARKAEQDNPPEGNFVEIDGVRLHYVEKGQGEPLVLLHGNGSLLQDFELSGLMDLAAERFHVIAFDRPGYGYSARPRDEVWTPAAQSDLLHAALQKLGLERFMVLGHSWGATVAIALALQYPAAVTGLVLASGYYYPTFRIDGPLLAAPAIPVVGDVLGYTLAPLMARLMWPVTMRKIFGPASVPPAFSRVAREMSLRPSQIHSSAVESGLMIPDAFAMRHSYRKLSMPVGILTGDHDRVVDPVRQSTRLHQGDFRQRTSDRPRGGSYGSSRRAGGGECDDRARR